MSRKKLERYFKSTREMGEHALLACGIKIDIDLRRLIEDKITVAQYVDMKYFAHLK